MTEHDLQNEIRMELTRRGCCAFRINVGRVKTADGRWFSTGTPPGFSDLFAVHDGRAYFIEVKVHPNTPSDEQINFIDQMRERYGCAGGVAYSVEDALRIVFGGDEGIEDRCICCGAYVPEGRQVCVKCERSGT